jgi:hypothetical protein
MHVMTFPGRERALDTLVGAAVLFMLVASRSLRPLYRATIGGVVLARSLLVDGHAILARLPSARRSEPA